jgi:hypothetical protein
MTDMAKVLRILVALLALGGGNAHATFHLWQITQLYSSADGKVQYVELMAMASQQQYIMGHTISSFQGSNSHVFVFPSNLPGDTGTTEGGGFYGGGMTTSLKSMLLGTQAFANLNIVAPDFIIPDGFLFTTNGRVDWSSGPTYDSLSYAALPADGTSAMFRSGASAMNAPLNFDGLSGTISPATLPNYTDLWWAGDAESGWGINLNHQFNQQQSDIIFATLFTYAADHSGLWLVATMNKQSDGSYTGALYQTTGNAFNASPWTVPTAAQVGTMTTSFAGSNQGTLVYTVNGSGVTKSITRQPFGPEPTCTFTSGTRAAATNYQDLWYAGESESGWGINFTQHGTTIFATLFTYAASGGKGMWLVATMAQQTDGSFSGDLLRTTGPAFNTTPWTPITASKAGTMRASFTNGVAGSLTYSVDGTSVTKTIQRQVFGTTQSVCN